MIKAYVVGISTGYEGEDIQIRYRIYKDEELICEKMFFQEYKKPLIVSHFALIALLRELKKYMEQEITIIINDPALNEQIKGTSTTSNKDVQRMASKVREQLNKFNNSVTIQDVSGNYAELEKWDEILRF